jgi:hypothetical protein
MARRRSSRLEPAMEISRATGLPWRVMVIVSPRST